MPLPRILGPVAIVGAGISGREAKRLLEALKVAPLAVLDDVPGKGDFSDPAELLRTFKPRTLVVSPGVPLSKPWIRDFEAAGGKVTSELEIACSCMESERIVAVTGSVGKSTTVSLLGAGARAFCPDAFVGGNLGIPFASYAADVVSGQRARTAWVVLELSSFQLERARNLRPEAVAITSLLQNHMERYPSLEAYYATKWQLATQAASGVVLNANGGDLRSYAEARHRENSKLHIEWASERNTFLKSADFARSRLFGAHNRDNLAVAAAVARMCVWHAEYIDGMLGFAGLPHRLQDAGTHGGVRFVNDSKATAIESVLTAVSAVGESLPAGRRLWLLAGGRDKGLPWPKLAQAGSAAGLTPVFFGECGELARTKSKLSGEVYPKLEPALRAIRERVSEGDIVLLSPGGSSLDEFGNFEQRGETFMRLAQEIFGNRGK